MGMSARMSARMSAQTSAPRAGVEAHQSPEDRLANAKSVLDSATIGSRGDRVGGSYAYRDSRSNWCSRSGTARTLVRAEFSDDAPAPLRVAAVGRAHL